MKLRAIKSRIFVLAGVLVLLVTVSAASGHKERVYLNEKIQVFVSVLPQAYFVERVGGSLVEITVLVGPGQSPATYDPSPHEITHLSDAHVYFKVGVPFEHRLLEKAMEIDPDLNIVDTRAGITLRPIEDHDPHPGGHDHEGIADPHIWLDPQLAKTQAAIMCAALKQLAPGHADDFDRNLVDFQKDLDEIDARISELMQPFSGKRFYVFHPSYGYFADRYGLKQLAVETSGKEPSARQLAILIDKARMDSISAIFVQAQFATTTAEAIAREIGVKVLTLDPLARDYLYNLEQMAKAITGAFADNKEVKSSRE